MRVEIEVSIGGGPSIDVIADTNLYASRNVLRSSANESLGSVEDGVDLGVAEAHASSGRLDEVLAEDSYASEARDRSGGGNDLDDVGKSLDGYPELGGVREYEDGVGGSESKNLERGVGILGRESGWVATQFEAQGEHSLVLLM